jgi:hypothetical protein
VLQDKLGTQKQKSVWIQTHKLIYVELLEAPLFAGAFFLAGLFSSAPWLMPDGV